MALTNNLWNLFLFLKKSFYLNHWPALLQLFLHMIQTWWWPCSFHSPDCNCDGGQHFVLGASCSHPKKLNPATSKLMVNLLTAFFWITCYMDIIINKQSKVITSLSANHLAALFHLSAPWERLGQTSPYLLDSKWLDKSWGMPQLSRSVPQKWSDMVTSCPWTNRSTIASNACSPAPCRGNNLAYLSLVLPAHCRTRLSIKKMWNCLPQSMSAIREEYEMFNAAAQAVNMYIRCRSLATIRFH